MIQIHSSTITTFVVNLIWTMDDYNFCYNFDMINYEQLFITYTQTHYFFSQHKSTHHNYDKNCVFTYFFSY